MGDMQRAERHLRQLAAAAGLPSLRAVCLAADVDRMTLRFALRGERAPRPDTIERLARALSVDAALIGRIFAGARTAREVQP